MCTAAKLISRITLAGVLLMLLLCGACQRRCQQLSEEPFQSLIDAEWRVVSSTLPQDQGLDAFNFYIFTFTENFQMSIFYVEGNEREDDPRLFGEWAVPERGILLGRVQDVNGNTYDLQYEYRLTNRLILRPAQGGRVEAYPFEGIISPDNQCTF